MENLEEAIIEESGDVIVRYYYGREVRVPKIVMQGELVKIIREEIEYIHRVAGEFNTDWWRGREYSLELVLGLLGENSDEDNM